MSEIDRLLKAVTSLKLDEIRSELNDLRAVQSWAIDQIGIDYSVGDEVTIISEEPQVVGGGWERHRNDLRVGNKGIVQALTFNQTSSKWVANVAFSTPEDGGFSVFALDAHWVAKGVPERIEEEHAPEEIALLANELSKAESKLAFVEECCDIMEKGSDPVVPLQQVRNMLEAPHRLLAEREKEAALEGVETPGCDCGQDGRGRAWHTAECQWRLNQVTCVNCGNTERQGCGCPAVSPPGAYGRFMEALSVALTEWHSDVPESRDVAKNAYLARKVTEVHEDLIREMSRVA